MLFLLKEEIASLFQQLVRLAEQKYPSAERERIRTLCGKIMKHASMVGYEKNDSEDQLKKEAADLAILALQVATFSGVDGELFKVRVQRIINKLESLPMLKPE